MADSGFPFLPQSLRKGMVVCARARGWIQGSSYPSCGTGSSVRVTMPNLQLPRCASTNRGYVPRNSGHHEDNYANFRRGCPRMPRERHRASTAALGSRRPTRGLHGWQRSRVLLQGISNPFDRLASVSGARGLVLGRSKLSTAVRPRIQSGPKQNSVQLETVGQYVFSWRNFQPCA